MEKKTTKTDLADYPDLAEIVRLWPELPEPARKQIITTAQTAINSFRGPKK